MRLQAVLGLAALLALPASFNAQAGIPRFGDPPRGHPWVLEPPRVLPPSPGPRLSARDLGLVINLADPDSVALGAHYAARRGIAPARVLRVRLPRVPALSREEFEAFKAEVDRAFGPDVQALALAWTQPWAVSCQSLTGALGLGFDPQLCENTCAAPQRVSPYFASNTVAPMRERGVRLSMQLAAPSLEQARALVDRGLAADASQTRSVGSAPATAWFLSTSDAARNVRSTYFPASYSFWKPSLDVRVAVADELRDQRRIIVYQTGRLRVGGLESLRFAPGALADHLTSLGGVLVGSPQMSILDWIAAGVTASYGTVSEPCNHPQKFPHPQILLGSYLSGATAIESYWRSVAWPQQGVFVGEPLAAPYAAP